MVSIVDSSPDMPCHGMAQLRPKNKLDDLDQNRSKSRPKCGYVDNEKRAAAAHVENEGGILQRPI